MPPALRGDVELSYSGAFFRGPLVEDGERIIGTRRQRQDLDLSLAFAVTDGLAVTAGLDITPSLNVSFTDDGTQMTYDPISTSGTYAGGPELGTGPTRSGGGLVGVWLGVAAGPYGRWMKTPEQFSWRVDVALRVPNSGGTFYDAADGSRGAAPGGTAIRIAGAFAVERGAFEPYMRMAYQYESRAVINIGDEQGEAIIDATVQAPSMFDILGGAELILAENREIGQRIAVDVFVSTGYRTRGQGASGVYLPDVIEQSRGLVVTTSEHLVGGGGLGLIINPNEYIGFRLAGDISAFTPYRIEHPFSVYQGAGSHQVGVNASVRGHIR
ncbi:MAG: hypothetical protein ACJATT_000080 [Myxococcota bacterium]|jgi:hypothetical protein